MGKIVSTSDLFGSSETQPTTSNKKVVSTSDLFSSNNDIVYQDLNKKIPGKPAYKESDLKNLLNLSNVVELKNKPEQVTITGTNVNPRRDAVEAAAAGLIKGSTLGASDKLIPLFQALTNIPSGQKPYGFKETFKNKEEEYKKAIEEAKAAPGCKAAYTGGEIASYFIPGSAPAKIFKGAGKIAANTTSKVIPKVANKFIGKVAEAGITGGLGMGVTGGVEKLIETGDLKQSLDETLKDALTGTILGGGFSAAGQGVAKAGKGISEKIIKSKILSKSENIDRDTKNLVKNNLFGSLKKINKEAEKRLNRLENQMENVLLENKKPINNIDLKSVLEKTYKDALSSKEFSTMNSKTIHNIINNAFKNGIRTNDGSTRFYPLDANNLKRSWKAKAKFNFGDNSTQQTVSKLWNKMYLNLRDEIGRKVPETLKLNQAESELIPIFDATKNLIKASEKRNFASLYDLLIGGFSGGINAPMIIKALESGNMLEIIKSLALPFGAVAGKKILTSPQAAGVYLKTSKPVSATLEKIATPQGQASMKSLYNMFFPGENK